MLFALSANNEQSVALWQMACHYLINHCALPWLPVEFLCCCTYILEWVDLADLRLWLSLTWWCTRIGVGPQDLEGSWVCLLQSFQIPVLGALVFAHCVMKLVVFGSRASYLTLITRAVVGHWQCPGIHAGTHWPPLMNLSVSAMGHG